MSEADKRCAIYARVSTQGQARDGTSLDSQVEKCREHAECNGYRAVAEFRDEVSGATLARTGLDQVRDMVEHGELDAIVVYDPDRLSRNLGHLMMLVEELERRRVEIVFVNAPHDNTPEGMMLLQMRGMFGQYERAKFQERSRRGKQHTTRNGKVILSWMEPYGYSYIAGEGRFEEKADEAEWVRRIFEWYVKDGVSLRGIAARLNEKGVPTKRGATHWAPSTIQSILTNSTYTGTWYFNKQGPAVAKRRRSASGPEPRREKSSYYNKDRGEWIGVGGSAVPAIVSQELFDGVRPQMDRNARLSKRNCKREYLLRGLMTCADCGRRITARLSGKTHQYYCTGRYEASLRDVCHMSWPNATKLDDRVWSKLARLLSNEKLIMRTLKERERNRSVERRREDVELASLHSSEQKVKADEARLLEAYRKGAIDLEQLEGPMLVLRKQRDALRQSRSDLQARIERHESAAAQEETVKSLVALVRAGLPHVSFEDKRAFLEAMGVTGVADGRAGKLVLSGFINQTITLGLADTGEQDPPASADGGTGLRLRPQDEHPVYANEKRRAVLEPCSIPFELTVQLTA